MSQPLPVLSYRFHYDGAVRHVDNVEFVNSALRGFEVRKAGRFSQKVKSYRLDKIVGIMERIVIDRPNRPESSGIDSILVSEHVTLGALAKDAV